MRASVALLWFAALGSACAGPRTTAPPRPAAAPTAAPLTTDESPPAAQVPADPPALTPLAITIDDLPYVGRLSPGDTREAAVRRMLEAADGVPITGFFVCRGRRHAAAWAAWMRSETEIANHTGTHRSIDEHPDVASWRREVEACQRVLEADARGPVRFFRYPYLRTGSDGATRDAGFAALESLGLTRAPVTVDTSDWALAADYARERDEAIAAAYIGHTRRAARRFRDLARADGFPDAPQILLIHANALAADHLGALLRALREDGFRFVSLEQALAHPMYAQTDGYVGDIGMSFVYRARLGSDRALEVPASWAWDSAQRHAMQERFSDREPRDRFELDAELSIRAVTEHAYIVTHSTPMPANSLVAEMQDGTLLFVDTPWTEAASRSLLDWVAARFGPRELVLINTHFHPDAVGGNRVFAEAGATIYASDLTARLTAERAQSTRRQLRSWLRTRPEVAARFDDYSPLPAAETFPLLEGLTLSLGEPVRIWHPGPMHSHDNVTVYLPRSRLLFGGCAIRAGDDLGDTRDADLEAWPDGLSSLESLELEHVIPGHGDRTDRGLLDHTRRLLARASAR